MTTDSEVRVLLGQVSDLLISALSDLRALQDLLAVDPLKVIHTDRDKIDIGE